MQRITEDLTIYPDKIELSPELWDHYLEHLGHHPEDLGWANPQHLPDQGYHTVTLFKDGTVEAKKQVGVNTVTDMLMDRFHDAEDWGEVKQELIQLAPEVR